MTFKLKIGKNIIVGIKKSQKTISDIVTLWAKKTNF
jgi:hypothetical protein